MLLNPRSAPHRVLPDSNVLTVSAAPIPVLMIFGPFDPSGSTCLPAEAVTCAETGCHAISVLTGTLVQDTAGLEHIEAITPELMDDQARCLLEDMPVHAMKAGPLYTTETVSVLAQIAADYTDIPLVVHLQRPPTTADDDDLDAEDSQTALLELVLPQTDLAVIDHTLLQQWQSEGILPGSAFESALDALLEYGANAVLVTGVPQSGAGLSCILRDEHGQTQRWPAVNSQPVAGTDGLLATVIATEMARGHEVPQAVERGLDIARAMASRVFQPGMGTRILNRSRQ